MSNSTDHQDLDYFNYDLPSDRVAQSPAEPRDSAKMLTWLNGVIQHSQVTELKELLKPGDVLVVNDTKVRPARMLLQKDTGGKAEVLLLDPTGRPNEWNALLKPAKKLPPGTKLFHQGQAVVEVVEIVDERRVIKLLDPDLAESIGQLPLPPYITEKLEDESRYQTVYADRVGSAAAPTAGLHFTPALLDDIESLGVEILKVELEVGIGTFKPISVENITEHKMHAERYCVSQHVWDRIQKAERVIAVGTTVVRTLESVAKTQNLSGNTELFISRDFDWKVVDLLMTNFHVPESSLLVMIDAFIGPKWKSIYEEALNNDYRFLSLGDCMFLERENNNEN